jgi:hypothetical protein
VNIETIIYGRLERLWSAGNWRSFLNDEYAPGFTCVDECI